MDRGLKIFKLSTILRCGSIILLFTLDKMYMASLPDTGLFSNIDFELDLFTWWEEVLMYSAAIAIIFNGCVSLGLSFRPRIILKNIIGNRYLLGFFFWIELLTLPFLLNVLIIRFKEEFLPPKETELGKLLGQFFPGKPVSNIYEQLIVIDLALLWISLLLFVLCFYKVLKIRQKLIQQEDLPIGFDSQQV